MPAHPAPHAAGPATPGGVRRVAVIDIGKTNVKAVLVDARTLEEIAVASRPNTVLAGPPWPHFDLAGHWHFLAGELAGFAREGGIDAISVTTHGAGAVLLDERGDLAAPMLDYEHDGPDAVAAAYDRLRPDFAVTGSPRLPGGLNLGAQLHWMRQVRPDLVARAAHVVTYPQYWGARLTGKFACDVCSLGCHTDLWDPWRRRFSPLVARLGLDGCMAPPRRPDELLGTLCPDVAARTGLAPATPVTVGIHDSNASLLPHVLARRPPFAVVSTGTWVIAMAIGGRPAALDPARDTLVNVDALGNAVPSARFMGGRIFELACPEGDVTPDAADRAMLLGAPPAVPLAMPMGSIAHTHPITWSRVPGTKGEHMLAISWYLALRTRTALDLIGAQGPVIVEGPFARNPDYAAMLAALSPGGVERAHSSTGTSVGAALLALDRVPAPATRPVPVPLEAERLRAWAARAQGLIRPGAR